MKDHQDDNELEPMTKQELAERSGFSLEKAKRSLHLPNRRNIEHGDRLSSRIAQEAIDTSWKSGNLK